MEPSGTVTVTVRCHFVDQSDKPRTESFKTHPSRELAGFAEIIKARLGKPNVKISFSLLGRVVEADDTQTTLAQLFAGQPWTTEIRAEIEDINQPISQKKESIATGPFSICCLLGGCGALFRLIFV